jgi:hypothetical protein
MAHYRSLALMKTRLSRGASPLVVVFCLALALSACFPDNVAVYDGPLQVEFRPTSATLNLANDDSYSANVQLIGPHQNRPLTIDFIVDDASTAVEGVHYVVEGRSTTIPANSSFADIEIRAIPEAFTDGSRRVIITLMGSQADDVRPAGNYRTLTLTISP